MAAGWRWFLYAGAVGSLAMPAYLVWHYWGGKGGHLQQFEVRWGYVMCGFMVLLFGLGALEAATMRLTMGSEEIELRSNLTTRRASYGNLLGRRLKRQGRELYMVIEVPAGKPLEISSMMALDARFRHWFDALPDLDAGRRR